MLPTHKLVCAFKENVILSCFVSFRQHKLFLSVSLITSAFQHCANVSDECVVHSWPLYSVEEMCLLMHRLHSCAALQADFYTVHL